MTDNENVQDRFAPPDTGKEVVAYRGGWGFRLPHHHTLTLSPDQQFVSLSIPDRGSIHYVERIEETADEFHVYVGEWWGGHGLRDLKNEYPFPPIDEELARLKRDYVQSGGNPTDAEAWAQGASYDSHTTWLRSEIRRLRSAGA